MRVRLSGPLSATLVLAATLSGTFIAHAADDPRFELGLFAGWGILDEELTGKSLALEHGTPEFGLRGSTLLGDHVTLFGDLGTGRYDHAADDTRVRHSAFRLGPEFLFGRPGARSRMYLAPALGWSFYDYSGSGATLPEDFDRSIASLGLGQRFLVDSGDVMRWEVRAETGLGENGVGGESVINYLALFGYSFGVAQKDSDGDGVPDRRDACPDTPKGALVDVRGCPLDTDGDGVFDGLDQCPDTPTGVKVDARGCPLPEPIKPRFVLEGVTFASDSAALTPASTVALDRVAASLKAWPEVRVEVGGHTDSTNTDAHNLRLSKARAESVKGYLVGKGIAADRMTTNGYGEGKPIADNATPAGRATNRRVELTRLN